MIININKVQSREEFFEYLSGYMADGDKLICEEISDDKLEFTLISPCGFPLVGYRDGHGVVFH